MKQSRITAFAVVLAAGSGIAYADLSTTVNEASFSRRYRELADGNVRIDDNLILDGADVISDGTREHLFNRSADASAYPSINSFGLQHAFRTSSSSTRFSVEWDFSSFGDFTRVMGVGESMRADIQFLISASVHLVAGTEYRLTWTGAGGSFIGDMPGMINSCYIAVAGDAVSPFTLGFGNNTPPTIDGDVSFPGVATSDVSFDLTLEGIFINQASAASPNTNWAQFARGSFMIEVIPSPAGMSVLALAGLASARRRR